MKSLLFIWLALQASFAFSYELKLTQFDQEKLAELVERLPETVRLRELQRISEPQRGITSLSVFPIEEKGFKFICESRYFNHSPVASSASCKVIIDEHHPAVEMNYDEFKIVMDDALISKQLYQSISYGKPYKEFRSEQREQGINFEGKDASIFRYYFKCAAELCTMKFSGISQFADEF